MENENIASLGVFENSLFDKGDTRFRPVHRNDAPHNGAVAPCCQVLNGLTPTDAVGGTDIDNLFGRKLAGCRDRLLGLLQTLANLLAGLPKKGLMGIAMDPKPVALGIDGLGNFRIVGDPRPKPKEGGFNVVLG